MNRPALCMLVGATALLLTPAANATNNDCCFDTNLGPVGGYYQCVSESSKDACFARSGIQIWAEDYTADLVTQTVCRLKAVFESDSCQVFVGGKPDGACTISDLEFEARAVPGLSPLGAVVVALLVAVGAVLMIRRRAPARA